VYTTNLFTVKLNEVKFAFPFLQSVPRIPQAGAREVDRLGAGGRAAPIYSDIIAFNCLSVVCWSDLILSRIGSPARLASIEFPPNQRNRAAGHDDSTKTAKRRGTVKATFKGDSMSVVYEEEDAVFNWKPGYGPHVFDGTMGAGTIKSRDYKREPKLEPRR